MANVLVIQRSAHLAADVRLEFVNGRDGQVAKATLTAISNVRWGSAEAREEQATAILWTLWGKQAQNAAEYLAKGSHVNIVGRVQNNNYERDGETVYGLAFTCEEIDYLDSKASAKTRQARREFVDEMNASERPSPTVGPAANRDGHAAVTPRRPRAERPRAAANA
jgi:single-strand DNA-binding protein